MKLFKKNHNKTNPVSINKSNFILEDIATIRSEIGIETDIKSKSIFHLFIQLFIDLEEPSFSVLDELKNPTSFINLVIIVTCFWVISFNYYLVSFYLKYAGGNIFINNLAIVVSEVLGNFSGGYIQSSLGTKKAYICLFSCALVLSIPLLYTQNALLIVFSVFCCKFSTEGAFLVAYNSNTELFPTLFVPFAFLSSGIISRLVTILASQVAEVKPEQVPIMIYMVCWLIAMFAALLIRKPQKQ